MLDAPQVNIDLPVLIKQMKEEKLWQEGKRNSMTVFKSEEVRIVLIAMPAGSELPKHVAGGTISVQVLEGRMEFKTDEHLTVLSKGQMLVLHKQIFHSVKALDETFFLLTLTVSAPTQNKEQA